jgi:hypothetical protein
VDIFHQMAQQVQGSTTTVTFKKGMFMLSATSNTTRHGYIGVASSTSNYTLVSEGSNGSLITANGSTLIVACWNSCDGTLRIFQRLKLFNNLSNTD